MSFEYDDSALSEDFNLLRFKLGDTVENEGPRPEGRNFSDAEITQLLTDESTVPKAQVAGLKQLAVEWRTYAISKRAGDTAIDAKEVAAGYQEQAEALGAEIGVGQKEAVFRVKSN